MAEDKKTTKATEEKKVEKTVESKTTETSNDKGARQNNRGSRNSRNNQRKDKRNSKKRSRRKKNEDGLDKRIVDIRRVTRVYKGGKRMSLSVLLVVGDKKGRVGAGLAKGADVKTAEEKAYNQAKKNMIDVQLKGTTIAHEITHKMKAAKIFMKPAAPGTGVIAGGALRSVLELVGVKDILTKVIGTNNNITNVYATIEALQQLKSSK